MEEKIKIFQTGSGMELYSRKKAQNNVDHEEIPGVTFKNDMIVFQFAITNASKQQGCGR